MQDVQAAWKNTGNVRIPAVNKIKHQKARIERKVDIE